MRSEGSERGLLHKTLRRRLLPGIGGFGAFYLSGWIAYWILSAGAGVEAIEVRIAVSAFCTIPLMTVFWLLLPSSVGRFEVRSLSHSLLACSIVLLPVLVRVALPGLRPAGDSGSWIRAALLLLPAAASEEIVFRGFLQDLFSPVRFPLIGLAVSSLLFGYVHADNPSASALGVINIVLFGVFLGLLRLRTRGLVIPVLFHWVWNAATGCVLGVEVSGLALPSLFRPAYQHSGKTFGPEEWPFTTVLAVVAIGTLGFSLLRDRERGGGSES